MSVRSTGRRYRSRSLRPCDRFRNVDNPLRFIDDRIVDEIAVDLDRSRTGRFRLNKRVDDFLCESELFFRRCKRGICRRNLVWMNAEFSLEAKVSDQLAGHTERFIFLDVDEHRVNRRL